MLDALLNVNTLATTQPADSANRSNKLIIGSLIAASLISVSVIIGMAMTKTLQVAQPTDTGKPIIFPSSGPTDYSWLAQRPVTDADLNNKDGLELDIMRNSIYARHGRRFTTTLLQQHFERQSWYRPRYSPDEFDKLNNNCQLLSPIECKNAISIASYQNLHNRRYFK